MGNCKDEILERIYKNCPKLENMEKCIEIEDHFDKIISLIDKSPEIKDALNEIDDTYFKKVKDLKTEIGILI